MMCSLHYVFIFFVCILSKNIAAMDTLEDQCVTDKSSSTLHSYIDPVEEFMSQHDLKFSKPKIQEDQHASLVQHCYKKMQYFDEIFMGHNNTGAQDSFDLKEILDFNKEGTTSLKGFCDIIKYHLHQQTFCRKEQDIAQSVISKTYKYYTLQWHIWEKRHGFFCDYEDAVWTEEALSWAVLTKESSFLMNQIQVWTTILFNVPEWYQKYKRQYDIVLSQPLVEQITKQEDVTNNPNIRAQGFISSINLLKKFIADLKKIQPVLFLLCDHSEQRLGEVMHRLGFNGPSKNHTMHSGMDGFLQAISDLEALQGIYEKKALEFPMLEGPKVEEKNSPSILLTSSDALNQTTLNKPRSTSEGKAKLSITPPKFPSSFLTSSGSPRKSQESPERNMQSTQSSPRKEDTQPSPRKTKKSKGILSRRTSYTHGSPSVQKEETLNVGKTNNAAKHDDKKKLPEKKSTSETTNKK